MTQHIKISKLCTNDTTARLWHTSESLRDSEIEEFRKNDKTRKEALLMNKIC